MDFDFTPEEQAFREEVRAFIAENKPANNPPTAEDIKEWHRKLGEKRWIGFPWPKEAGGGGASFIEQFILKEEMGAAKAPALGSDFMGLTWVGPSIIKYGTDAQREKFLPQLLSGDSVWCTGYSEPDHGSDLGGLQTRAVLDGDHYVINGSKIWTTLAHEAEYCFLLARTDPEAHKYAGISCILTPMDTPGIEIQPIPNLYGKHSFNQVFFNDVRVPADHRLGKEGQGWRVVMGALAHERSGISEATEKIQHLEDLIELARNSRKNGGPALEDTATRRRLARFQAQISAMRLNGMRYLTKQLRGEDPGTETSVNKVLRGRLEFEMSDVALSLLGASAQEYGPWQQRSLDFHGSVIGGGSPNIQRNIIGERILGLQKD
jgi:alkylation response protein AidB-like acyl-CoA dehydrogenase